MCPDGFSGNEFRIIRKVGFFRGADCSPRVQNLLASGLCGLCLTNGGILFGAQPFLVCLIAVASLFRRFALLLFVFALFAFNLPFPLIVLGAATLGTTRLIDNVDVVKQDGKD